MRVLLTGAGGFVGSHLLRHLLAETDWDLVCPVTFRHRGTADRIASSVRGKKNWQRRLEVVMHDLTAPASAITMRSFEGCEVILNVASESHVDRSIADPAPFIANNVALAVNIGEIARAIGPRLLLQMSTDEVYGPALAGQRHAEWSPIKPSNPYSASKAAQEAVLFAYWRTYRVPLLLTNTMNIFGEMQDSEKMLPKTIRALLRGEPVTVHTAADGTPGSRFYLHARNLADAWLWLARTHTAGLYPAADVPIRYNIVGEREVDNLQLVHAVADILDVKPRIETVDFHTSRPGHDLRYALDGSKIAAAGWKAPLSFDESLERTVRWTAKHREWLL